MRDPMNCASRAAGKIVAYYITPHGFGHAVRSLEIIRQLLAIAPDVGVVIISDIPQFLMDQNLGGKLPYRRKRLDVGLLQLDSLRFNLQGTLTLLDALHNSHDTLVSEEAAFLSSARIGVVVSDIGFIPFHAAELLGIPGIGISNFTWDWIYSHYAQSDPRWWGLVEWIRSGYGKADLLLRLPMHGDCSAFRRCEDVPLVARHAAQTRDDVRRGLGIDSKQRLYLIAFSSLELSPGALKRIEAIPGAVFLYKHPLHYGLANGISLDPFPFSYADVVGAVDAVITKPGYGIVSDCLAHSTPMIYCDRGDFAEYPVLVETVEAHLASAYLPSDDLCHGRWEQALHAIETASKPARPVRADGARVCAEQILATLGSIAEVRS